METPGRFWNILSYVLLATQVVVALWYANVVDEPVPISIGPTGEVRSYGEAIELLMLPGVSFLIFLLMNYIKNKPNLIHLSSKKKPGFEAEYEALGIHFMHLMTALSMGIFLLVLLMMVNHDQMNSDVIIVLMVPIILLMSTVPMIWLQIKVGQIGKK